MEVVPRRPTSKPAPGRARSSTGRRVRLGRPAGHTREEELARGHVEGSGHVLRRTARNSASAACMASSAAAPKRSKRRPPNAMLQAANHAQPRKSPAMTSESQCTSSKTRVHATATAIPTAAPARTRGHACRRLAENQSRRCVERSSCRRVAARERRPERLGDRVQRRPDAVEQILEAVREQQLTHEHRQEKDWNPAVGLSRY